MSASVVFSVPTRPLHSRLLEPDTAWMGAPSRRGAATSGSASREQSQRRAQLVAVSNLGVCVHRPCLDCGTRQSNGSRCRSCSAARDMQRAKRRGKTTERGYGANYRRERRGVLADADRCHICGGAPTATDPLTADHIVPRSKGGGTKGNLRPAHRSCNSRRGNRG